MRHWVAVVVLVGCGKSSASKPAPKPVPRASEVRDASVLEPLTSRQLAELLATAYDSPLIYAEADTLVVMDPSGEVIESPFNRPDVAEHAFARAVAAEYDDLPSARRFRDGRGKEKVAVMTKELLPGFRIPADVDAALTPAQRDDLRYIRPFDVAKLLARRGPILFAHDHEVGIVDEHPMPRWFPDPMIEDAVGQYEDLVGVPALAASRLDPAP